LYIEFIAKSGVAVYLSAVSLNMHSRQSGSAATQAGLSEGLVRMRSARS
jgi:hypothetical protein